jgi:hypothetical protein
MRGRAETVRSAAVWADTTRPYPVGQEGVQTMVDISFRVGHEPGTTPFVDTSAFASTDGETSYNPTVPQRRTSGTSVVVLVSELRIFYLPAS